MSHIVYEQDFFIQRRSKRKSVEQYLQQVMSNEFFTHPKEVYVRRRIMVLASIVIGSLWCYYV